MKIGLLESRNCTREQKPPNALARKIKRGKPLSSRDATTAKVIDSVARSNKDSNSQKPELE